MHLILCTKLLKHWCLFESLVSLCMWYDDSFLTISKMLMKWLRAVLEIMFMCSCTHILRRQRLKTLLASVGLCVVNETRGGLGKNVRPSLTLIHPQQILKHGQHYFLYGPHIKKGLILRLGTCKIIKSSFLNCIFTSIFLFILFILSWYLSLSWL